MLQQLIPYIIWVQILVGFFHLGMGIDEWRNIGTFDTQTLFLLSLGLGTWVVYLRLKKTPIETRSFKIIFEHAVFIGMITWLFYHPWWEDWELFLIIFMSINLGIVLLLMIFEKQFERNFWGWNWWIPDYFWRIGSLLTLINTITIPAIFILLNESLMLVWVFFGINWVFLWKEDFSKNTPEIL